ncbi:MAG: transcription termination/antitermination protein NusA [Parcubacteria group bacterium]|nr:transcription termination/antitermination protein NusA [Parcubacteria group bacterium]
MDLKQFASALNQISEEKGISPEKVIETIEMALAAAYKKEYGEKGQIVRAKFDSKTGDVTFSQIKIVVDESMLKPEEEGEESESSFAPAYAEASAGKESVEGEKKIRFNSERHIMLDEAKKIKKDVAVRDELEFVLEAHEDFGRIAAQTAKQVIIQRIREAEREAIWNEYKDKEGELVSGIVQRVELRNIFIDLGKTLAILPREEQVLGEKYNIGVRMKFFLLSVSSDPKGPGIVLSRSHPKMISRLFELEVPEIVAGTVEIKSIAREAGNRTKIAVASSEEGIDPVGSCVGQKGTRVSAVISEIGSEKIDIIEWSEDPEVFVGNAMSPAKVTKTEVMPRRHTARVFVPEDQISLAIGKAGQNVRLAAKLTGWKIDVAGATLTAAGIKEGAALSDLKGVGEKTAEVLREAGLNTPEDIGSSTIEDLTKIEGIGEKTAEKIMESAKKLLEDKNSAETKS